MMFFFRLCRLFLVSWMVVLVSIWVVFWKEVVEMNDLVVSEVLVIFSRIGLKCVGSLLWVDRCVFFLIMCWCFICLLFRNLLLFWLVILILCSIWWVIILMCLLLIFMFCRWYMFWIFLIRQVVSGLIFSRCRMFCGFGLLFMMVLFLVICLFLNMMIWWYFGISFLCFELLVFLMIRCCLFLVFLLKLMMFECLVSIVGFFGLCVLNRLVMCGRLLVMLWVFDVFCGILVMMLFMFIGVLFCRLMIECGGSRYCVGRLVFGIDRLLFLVLMMCMIGCRFLVWVL